MQVGDGRACTECSGRLRFVNGQK